MTIRPSAETGAPQGRRRVREGAFRRAAVFALLYVTVTVSLSFGAQAMLTYHQGGQATLEGAELSTPHRIVWALIDAIWENNDTRGGALPADRAVGPGP